MATESLGFTAFGVDGGEIMSAVQIAMIAELPYNKLRDAVINASDINGGPHLAICFSALRGSASG